MLVDSKFSYTFVELLKTIDMSNENKKNEKIFRDCTILAVLTSTPQVGDNLQSVVFH